MHCSTLTLNMIPMENKNMIHFKQRLLPNCLPHDLEILTMNGGEITSQYHTPLAVAKFTGRRKKVKCGYFIATPPTCWCFKYVREGTQKFPELLQKTYLKYSYEFESLVPFQVPARDWMQWFQCCSHCWQHCLISSVEMLSRATSSFCWTSATLGKMPPSQILLHPWIQQKSQQARSGEWGGHNHHFVWPKTAGCSMLCGRGHCHGARTNPHSATFLDVFGTGSHAIISPHSRNTTDLLFVLEG